MLTVGGGPAKSELQADPIKQSPSQERRVSANPIVRKRPIGSDEGRGNTNWRKKEVNDLAF